MEYNRQGKCQNHGGESEELVQQSAYVVFLYVRGDLCRIRPLFAANRGLTHETKNFRVEIRFITTCAVETPDVLFCFSAIAPAKKPYIVANMIAW